MSSSGVKVSIISTSNSNNETSSITVSSVRRTGNSIFSHKNLVQDEKLVAATLASLKDHLDPSKIIKEELKWLIQSRRVAEGKEALKVEFIPPRKNEMTPDEIERAQKRKEQNRLAARRFRRKQRDTNVYLLSKTKQLESSNKNLKNEMGNLQREKHKLYDLLTKHVPLCRSQSQKEELKCALDRMFSSSSSQS
ncbi:hypothetical protein LOTGIDRAFT_233903 [Lottia gigantea]|uniref:BZIP domain-containing protein n=1 Tax=Lottia gigantea TaxID=225164 RepID=V3ZFW6_LOTGI|nr:hypothetical protein LOTGIDRAFT_233903 [Lottia gigantea]ESO90093.1 hypothetical protein LOTGIDRAFT_233903 [Lottia gigantea]